MSEPSSRPLKRHQPDPRPMFGPADVDVPCPEALAERDYIVRRWIGVAIFNDSFDKPEAGLPGAEEDMKSVHAAFTAHGCVLDLHRGRTRDQMVECIRESLPSGSFDGQDAFLCIIWSHGGYSFCDFLVFRVSDSPHVLPQAN